MTTQIDVEDLMSILWCEGFEYEILSDEEDTSGVLRVYGGESVATIGELFPGTDGWAINPTSMTVRYPYWVSVEPQNHDLDDVENAHELFSLIANSLLAEEV
jgi:hypothetical protein